MKNDFKLIIKIIYNFILLMSSGENYEYFFKIVLLGDSVVGKSSLILCLLGTFWDNKDLKQFGLEPVRFIYFK